MFKKIQFLFGAVCYKLAVLRHFYTHRAVGQRTDAASNTIIIYTLMGKRDVYEILLHDLMEDPDLLGRFHPCQAAKFGAMSLGDVLFALPSHQRHKRYKSIKMHMLESFKG